MSTLQELIRFSTNQMLREEMLEPKNLCELERDPKSDQSSCLEIEHEAISAIAE